MSRVYIVNKGVHQFDEAEQFGELIYMTEGMINKFDISKMARNFSEYIEQSESTDYLLITSMSVMNVIACSMFVAKHKKLNLLLYKGDAGAATYLERNIQFEDPLKERAEILLEAATMVAKMPSAKRESKREAQVQRKVLTKLLNGKE